jgi:hypothetical protein
MWYGNGNQSKVYQIVTQSHTKVFTKFRKVIFENPKIRGKRIKKLTLFPYAFNVSRGSGTCG